MLEGSKTVLKHGRGEGVKQNVSETASVTGVLLWNVLKWKVLWFVWGEMNSDVTSTHPSSLHPNLNQGLVNSPGD